MSEAGDWDPGPWRGYDFRSARKVYDAHVGRSYDDAVHKSVKLENLIPASLKTDARSPVVIACDVTGSMGEWPATIFEKLPLLDLEGKEYLDDLAISFAAVGDAYYNDRYPLQVQEFGRGKELTDRLKALVIEGGGGGSVQESYDLPALYYAHNVKMSKANKPIFIFIGDEKFYPLVDQEQAKSIAQVSLEKKITSKEAIDQLKKKFSVYAIRKLYYGSSGDGMSEEERVIQQQWEDYLGADHVAILPEARRVVDVILGILAQETGKVPYFNKELGERQTDAQVKTVLKALKTIHHPKLLADPGKSVMRRTGKAGKTKSLL